MPCESSSSKHLKINNSTCSGIVCESLQEEFHKSQNGAELAGIYRYYCLFKNLYLEQCFWLFENVGLHSQYFDLTVTCKLHYAKDHTVKAAGPLFKATNQDLKCLYITFRCCLFGKSKRIKVIQ